MDSATILQAIALLASNAIVAVVLFAAQRRANEKDIEYRAVFSEINKSLTSCASSVTEIKGKVSTLYEWHDKEDSNGLKIWYMPRSVADMQKDIVTTQNSLVEVLRDLQRNHTDFTKFMEKQSETLALIHMELVNNNKDREVEHNAVVEKLESLKQEVRGHVKNVRE